ncbi:Alanyl-tRNA synthetase, partial [hydrothermal vent metagenome]
DLLLPIIRAMERLTGEEYEKSAETDVSFRVIADHVRAATFLVAEGVHPSNEGRGYVLRRILRRALRHGMMLGVKEPFAHKLTGVVTEIMKEAYPELSEYSHVIERVVKAEEESFGDTLEYGMRLLNETMEKVKTGGGDTIPGEEAFKLYDTYGFPMDLAREIAFDAGMEIDMAGFEKQMTLQREKARVASRFEPGAQARLDIGCAATQFKGYENNEIHGAVVLEIYKDGQATGSATQGDEVELLLDVTPFYAESGGQASDTGVISNESFRAMVLDVSKPDGKHWFHKARVDYGSIKKGDTVTAKIDAKRREDIRRNHSATHLLHSALREVLGAHVKQAGSLVAAERMRFDYTHFTAPKESEVKRIERIVNEKIMNNFSIATEVKSVEEAVGAGAMALFGEKYGDEVRVVTMGDYSMELCGGTHARATGEIGPFKIVSEGGVAAGVRRIEGVTGHNALDHFDHWGEELAAVGEKIKSNRVDLPLKVGKLMEKSKEQEKEIKRLKEKLLNQGKNDGSDYETGIAEFKGIKVITTDLKEEDADFAKGFIDKQRNENKSSVCVAGSRQDGKAIIIVGVTKDITGRCNAGKIIKEVAGMVGGGGGGRPDFAQAGGKNPGKLSEALQAAPSIVKNLLK